MNFGVMREMESQLEDGTNIDQKISLDTRKNSRVKEQPGWADGLRKLYDSVVEEPIPESFNELLKKLDQNNDDRSS